MALTEEQNTWLKTVLKVNVAHADVVTDPLNKSVFTPKKMGEQYEGEHEKAGWRGSSPETSEQKNIITRKFSDEERKNATLRADADGRLNDAQNRPAEGRQLYVMSAGTGEMMVAKEYEHKDSVIEVDGKNIRRDEYTHHSSILGGGDVAGGGMVELSGGKVEKISNVSGHYKPQFVHLLQVVEELLKSGAMLDTDLVDQNGKAVSDDVKKVYKHTKIMLGKVAADKIEMDEATTKKPSDAEAEQDAAYWDERSKRYNGNVELAKRGLDALRKMGVGPRNKMGGAVEFIDAAPDATGAQMHASKSNKVMPVEKFLERHGMWQPNLNSMGKTAAEIRAKIKSVQQELDEVLAKIKAQEKLKNDDLKRRLDEMALKQPVGKSPYDLFAEAMAAPDDEEESESEDEDELTEEEMREYELLSELEDLKAASGKIGKGAGAKARADLNKELLEKVTRTEDRTDDAAISAGKGLVVEGQSPAVNNQEWDREIGDLAEKLKTAKNQEVLRQPSKRKPAKP